MTLDTWFYGQLQYLLQRWLTFQSLMIVVVILLVGLLGVLLWRAWKTRSTRARAAASVLPEAPPALGRRALLNVWKRFRKDVSDVLAGAEERYAQVIVLGPFGAGKTSVIDRFIDFRGQAHKGVPSPLGDARLQLYVGSQTLVQELSSDLLNGLGKDTRRALHVLWKHLFARRSPGVVIVLSAQSLIGLKPEDLKRQAELLRGKLNILSSIRKQPVAFQVVLSHMDQWEGYAELAGLFQSLGVPFQCSLGGLLEQEWKYQVEPRFAGLDDLRAYLPVALTRLNAGEYRRCWTFFLQAQRALTWLPSFLETLCAPELNSLPPVPGTLYFSGAGTVHVPPGPFASEGRLGPVLEVGLYQLRHRYAATTLAILAALPMLVLYANEVTLLHDLRLRIEVLEQAPAAPAWVEAERTRTWSTPLDLAAQKSHLALEALEAFHTRLPLAQAFHRQEKDALRARLAAGIRDGYLLPAARYYGQSTLKKRFLYAVALLYAAKNNELGTLGLQEASDWATIIGVPVELVNDYIAGQESPWRGGPTLPDPEQRTLEWHASVHSLLPWKTFLLELEAVTDPARKAPLRLKALREQALVLAEPLAMSRHFRSAERIQRLLTLPGVTPTPVQRALERLFSDYGGELRAQTWLYTQQDILEELLQQVLADELSPVSPQQSDAATFLRALHVALRQAPTDIEPGAGAETDGGRLIAGQRQKAGKRGTGASQALESTPPAPGEISEAAASAKPSATGAAARLRALKQEPNRLPPSLQPEPASPDRTPWLAGKGADATSADAPGSGSDAEASPDDSATASSSTDSSSTDPSATASSSTDPSATASSTAETLEALTAGEGSLARKALQVWVPPALAAAPGATRPPPRPLYRITLEGRTYGIRGEQWVARVASSAAQLSTSSYMADIKKTRRLPFFGPDDTFQEVPPSLALGGTEGLPGIYTQPAFQEVLAVLADCAAELQGLPLARREKEAFWRFLMHEARGYAGRYREALRRFYQGVSFRASTPLEQDAVLAMLTEPSAPLTEHLFVVATHAQVGLPSEGVPPLLLRQLKPLVDSLAGFGPILRLMEDKEGSYPELERYYALLTQLRQTLQPGLLGGEAEGTSASSAPADADSGAARSSALADGLSPMGKQALLLMSGKGNPTLRQVGAWLDAAGLLGPWRKPFMAPVVSVYEAGQVELESAVAEHWAATVSPLLDPLLASFPFSKTAKNELSYEALSRLLRPGGDYWTTFGQWIGPVLEAQPNGTFKPRLSPLGPLRLPPSMLPLTHALVRVRKLLWDDAGEPRALGFELMPLTLPVPKEKQVVVMAFVKAGSASVFGFNQTPGWKPLQVAWWQKDTASAGIQLGMSGSPERRYRAVETESSLWSFHRLLLRAQGPRDGVYSWLVPIDEASSYYGEVRFALRANPWAGFEVVP